MTKKRILLVDDEHNILKSLCRILDEKYSVATALGGQVAMDLLATQAANFDLILTDFMMPNVSGQKLYEFVAREFPGFEQRIIFMTGGMYTPEVKIFLDSHKNPVLYKPFDQKDLLAIIESIQII